MEADKKRVTRIETSELADMVRTRLGYDGKGYDTCRMVFFRHVNQAPTVVLERSYEGGADVATVHCRDVDRLIGEAWSESGERLDCVSPDWEYDEEGEVVLLAVTATFRQQEPSLAQRVREAFLVPAHVAIALAVGLAAGALLTMAMI